MTTPVLQTKTWQYATNAGVRTPASVADALAYQAWWIAAFLTGNVALKDFDNNAIAGGSVLGKWTIYSSCDSASAGSPNDGVDHLHIGGAYTPGDWVRADEGTPHSWYVLKSPATLVGGPFYIGINFNGSTAASLSYFMSKSPYITGGTTANKPTASNEAISLANRAATHNATITQGRMRGTLATDGNFVIQHSIDGWAYFDYFLAGCTLAETGTLGTEEQHNFWFLNDFENTSIGQPPGAPQMANWQSFTSNSHTLGRGPTAGVLTGGVTLEEPYAGGAAVFAGTWGKDATSNKFRNRQIVLVTTNPNSERGVIVDITLCPRSNTAWLTGDFVPDSGVGQFREFMRAADFLVPANGVTQVL